MCGKPVVEAGMDGQLGCRVVSAALFAGCALGRLADIAVWERRDGGGCAFHLRIVSFEGGSCPVAKMWFGRGRLLRPTVRSL